MYLDSYTEWSNRKLNSIKNLTNGTSKFYRWTIHMIEIGNIAYLLRTNITFLCIRINETRKIWRQMPFHLVFTIFLVLHVEHVKWRPFFFYVGIKILKNIDLVWIENDDIYLQIIAMETNNYISSFKCADALIIELNRHTSSFNYI